MLSTLTITDESVSGASLNVMTLECFTERMSLREIIRARIYQEVRDYNLGQHTGRYQGLVQPAETERALNGYPVAQAHSIDWEKQYEAAISAFLSNGFFVIVGDRQIEDLDEILDVTVEDECSFVKLTPLVGG